MTLMKMILTSFQSVNYPTPDMVDDLLASINYKKKRPKSKGGKKRKTSDAELLFPDPQGH